MTRPAVGAAVWLRAGNELRRRWRSWLGLALLIGLAGGFVVGSAAGARRTTTAYDRLLAGARPFDVLVGVGCDEELDEEACAEHMSTSIERVLDLPPVADGAVGVNYLLPLLDSEGFSIQPQDRVSGEDRVAPGDTCVTGNGSVEVLGSPSGRLGTELNQHRFVSGRPANLERADEVVLSVAAAREADVRVGETLRIVPVDACGDTAPEEWPEPYEVTVVGLHVTPGEVEPETGRYLQSVTVTPPLLARLRSVLPPSPAAAMVVLRQGATADDLTEAAEAIGIRLEVVIAQDEFTESVRRGLKPDALTLWLLAALGGVAAVIVLGQALARQTWGGADEIPALRAMGFTGTEFALVGAVEGAAVAAMGAVVTAVAAVVVSPLFPIGRARIAEPDPGVRVDAAAITTGALAVAAITFAAVLVLARRVAARTAVTRPLRTRPAAVTAWVSRLGARPSVVVGARMALERGYGALAVPIRTGFTGIAVGMLALSGSLTFGADLQHLLETPSLVGWNWDVAFLSYEQPDNSDGADQVALVEQLVERALTVEGVARAGFMTLFPPLEGPLLESLSNVWPLSFSTGPGSIAPTVTRGRAPAGPDELLVTATILSQLGVEIGDTVEVRGNDNSKETLSIVGTGVLPIGDGNFENTVALSFEGMRRLAADVEPQMVIVDLEPGANRQATIAALADIGLFDAADVEDPAAPASVDIVSLDVSRADDLPRLLGGLMAVLGTGVLVHLVYSGVRHGRRDLATLRALGFTGPQVASAIAWQATLAALAPFAVGALGGAIVGRLVWLTYADRLGVAPATVVAWRPIVGFLAAFLVVANVVGIVIGRGIRVSSPSVVLRTE